MSKNLKQRKMPVTREAITHEFSIAGAKGYITVGLFEDGTPGEIFINVSKEGSTISGLFDAFSIAVSFALQYGVPVDKFIEKFSYMKFEPAGFTGTDMGYAHSIVDYCFRWINSKFGNNKKIKPVQHIDASTPELPSIPPKNNEVPPSPPVTEEQVAQLKGKLESIKDIIAIDSPPCHSCGNVMVRNGSCYKCLECGETSGCS